MRERNQAANILFKAFSGIRVMLCTVWIIHWVWFCLETQYTFRLHEIQLRGKRKRIRQSRIWIEKERETHFSRNKIPEEKREKREESRTISKALQKGDKNPCARIKREKKPVCDFILTSIFSCLLLPSSSSSHEGCVQQFSLWHEFTLTVTLSSTPASIVVCLFLVSLSRPLQLDHHHNNKDSSCSEKNSENWWLNSIMREQSPIFIPSLMIWIQ